MRFSHSEILALGQYGLPLARLQDLHSEVTRSNLTVTLVSEGSYILRDGDRYVVYLKDLLDNWYLAHSHDSAEDAILDAVGKRSLGRELIWL